MAVLANKPFVTNILDRVLLVLDSSGPTAIEIVEIADPLTGSPIDVLNSVEAVVTFPDSLTQTPGNDLSWFSQQYIIQTAGEYVVEFNPDIGTNFAIPLVVEAGGLPTPSLQVCKLTDFVVNAQGQGLENVTVAARILSSPLVVTGAAVSTDPIVAVTDENGYFSLDIIRNAVIDVIIPVISYRRTVTVPDASSASLFSIAVS